MKVEDYEIVLIHQIINAYGKKWHDKSKPMNEVEE